MNYDGQSPIQGAGTVTPAAIDAWFAKYGTAPAGLGAAVTLSASAAGLNSDLLAAQIAHETGYWTSAIARDKNNPAGIGAENDDPYGKAITFPTVAAGIDAMVAHLLTYIKGDGPWTAIDPRYAAVKAAHWLGTVKTLSDLNGKWAYPGTTYGAQIASRANALLAFAQTQAGAPMAGDDPRFQWTPDTNEFGYPQGTHGRNGQPIELLILHITAGTDSQSWLLGGHGSSTHYLTNKDGTPRAQHVADADAAWTPGSRDYALRSINVEVEMLNTSDWADAIMREVARTIAPIMQRHNIPAVYLGRDNGPGKRGMIGHRDVPDGAGGWGGSSHHDDPGANFDWTTFQGYVAAEMAGGQPAPSDAALWFPETGHSIGGGFRAFWEANGGLAIFGYPLTDELQEDGMIVQYFERAVFEFHPENQDPYRVLLRRLGADALAAKEAA